MRVLNPSLGSTKKMIHSVNPLPRRTFFGIVMTRNQNIPARLYFFKNKGTLYAPLKLCWGDQIQKEARKNGTEPAIQSKKKR